MCAFLLFSCGGAALVLWLSLCLLMSHRVRGPLRLKQTKFRPAHPGEHGADALFPQLGLLHRSWSELVHSPCGSTQRAPIARSRPGPVSVTNRPPYVSGADRDMCSPRRKLPGPHKGWEALTLNLSGSGPAGSGPDVPRSPGRRGHRSSIEQSFLPL